MQRPTRISSLRGSIYNSKFNIQEILKETVDLEIKVSEPPISKEDIQTLIEKYNLLIEYYNFSKKNNKSKFYIRRYVSNILIHIFYFYRLVDFKLTSIYLD